MRIRTVLLTGFLALGALSGCSTVKENAGACQVPPAPQREVIPKAPVSEQTQIWQPGYWDWNGSTYNWREGRWIKQDGRSNQWMAGYWDRDTVPGPCHWLPAHWM